MDAVREWAAAICVAAVLCAAVGMAAPEGKQAKCLRLVLSAVMLCLLISPLSQLNSCREKISDYVSEPIEVDHELMELVEAQTASAMSRSVERLTEQQLAELGFTAQEILIDMDISDDGCISIGQVTIKMTGADEDAKRIICDRLYDRLGLTAEVVAAEE